MFKHRVRQWLIIGCLTAIITACGGGGGSGGSNSNGTSAASGTGSSAPSKSTNPVTEPTSGNHSVHLTWAAPTTRADGSALPISAIEGYRLFYVREDASSSDDSVVTISGGTTTRLDLSLAYAGTYTFAITAVDTDGAESALSAPVSITIN